MELTAIVVGAGIGGLAASIALRKAGYSVTIFERSQFKSEVGAAITITPNGSRILDRWGFDFQKARVSEGCQIEMVDGKTLQPLFESSFLDVKQRFGYSMGFYHRVDLHQTLRELAESLDVKIELGCPIEEVETSGNVILHNGNTVTADLVVIADGVYSKHLSKITGKDEPLHLSDRSVIRALVSQEKIRSNPKLEPVFGQKSPGWFVPCTLPPEPTQLVTYGCRNNEVLNIGIVHYTLPGYEGRKDWHSPISLPDAQKTIENFDPVCHELLALSDATTIYALSRREILTNFVNDRIVVIGDAAHVMPPTHAQGASATIEEACALETFLTSITDSSQIPARLKLYEKLVKPRMQTVQLLSQTIPGQNNQFRQQAEAIWEGGGHGQLYPDETVYYHEPIRNFFYGYDMRSEAEKAIRKVQVTA